MELAQEQWRPVPDFHNYECSNLGRFRHATTLRILKKYSNHRTGRRFVKLYRTGRNRSINTGPFLARAWIGERPAGMQIDHIDGDKGNEQITNLEYVTQSTNIKRSFDNGLHPLHGNCRHSFLTHQDYDEIHRLAASGMSQVAIGRMKGLNNSTISKILSGKINPRIPRECGPFRPSRKEKQETRLQEAAFHLSHQPGLGYERLARVMNIARSMANRYMKELRKRAREVTTPGATCQ